MENSWINQYLSFLQNHNSLEDATEDGPAGICIYDAYVRRARIITRPPPGNLEVNTNDEVELFAGS